MADVRCQERQDSTKNGVHGDLRRNPLDDKNIDPDRRCNHADFYQPDQYYPEPDRVEIKSHNHRVEDGNRQDNDGQGIHDTAEGEVDHHDKVEILDIFIRSLLMKSRFIIYRPYTTNAATTFKSAMETHRKEAKDYERKARQKVASWR